MSFTSLLNLAGIREALRVRAGTPEKGTVGKDRADKAINYAVRKFQNELPQAFQREELRMQLQPLYEITVNVDDDDARVLLVHSSTSTILGNDGTEWARWIDITDADGKVYRRRVRETFRDSGSFNGGISFQTIDFVLLDKPVPLAGEADLAAKLFTLEYPLPPDWKDTTDVWRLDGGYPRRLAAVFGEELERVRMSGDWLKEGKPEAYARGDFFQLRAPHDTPTTALIEIPTSTQWGWNTDGEHDDNSFDPHYEAAGSFMYCYCLVWGRHKAGDFRNVFENPPNLAVARGRPFYISAPSAPTAEVETTWGGPTIWVLSANQGYVESYASDEGAYAWERHGLEKWWFRARTAYVSTGTTNIGKVEADGEFYFWQVQAANDTVVIDRGQSPVDVSFPLKEFTGHQSLRFDKIPSEITDIAVRGRRRQDLLKDDADVIRCPVDCLDAIVFLTLSILAGERDGNMGRMKEYRGLYQEELKALRKQYAMPGTRNTPVGSIADGDSVFSLESPVGEDLS